MSGIISIALEFKEIRLKRKQQNYLYLQHSIFLFILTFLVTLHEIDSHSLSSSPFMVLYSKLIECRSSAVKNIAMKSYSLLKS